MRFQLCGLTAFLPYLVLHFLIYYADRLCLDQARTTKVLDYLLSFTHDRVVLKKALETVQLLFKGGYVKGKLSDLSKLRMVEFLRGDFNEDLSIEAPAFFAPIFSKS